MYYVKCPVDIRAAALVLPEVTAVPAAASSPPAAAPAAARGQRPLAAVALPNPVMVAALAAVRPAAATISQNLVAARIQ